MWPPSFPQKKNTTAPLSDDEPKVFRVSEVNRLVRYCLEKQWDGIWVEGEISNATRAASGHVYFTLNDEQSPAQISAVMFRGDLNSAKARVENGARVKFFGSLSLYEARGSFQLIAKKALAVGFGDLAAEFEHIKNKLAAEGLFDPTRKRTLPFLPRTVGVVTSAHGAAIHDIIQVAKERFPLRIVVSDCRVQGQDAPTSIIQALKNIQKLEELDVVIIARGGGSSEDLWAFNDEQVARAIATCRVPTISGIGHEVDTTIADFIADVRAATPSNAAELLVPKYDILVQELQNARHRLERAMDQYIAQAKATLRQTYAHFRDPQNLLFEHQNRLQQLTFALANLGRTHVTRRKNQLAEHQRHLENLHPRTQVSQKRFGLSQMKHRLEISFKKTLSSQKNSFDVLQSLLFTLAKNQTTSLHRNHLGQLVVKLDSMSPLKVLSRGYAIAMHQPSGKALTHVNQVQEGEMITVRLARGALETKVEKKMDSEIKMEIFQGHLPRKIL